MILLIEDDADHADLFRRCLDSIQGRPYELRHVAHAAAAGKALRDEAIDVIVLDYRLGLESGLDLLRRFRAEGEGRPVIVLTGHGNEYVAVEMMRAGADDYVVKTDLNPVVLAKVIRRAIELRRADRKSKEREALIRCRQKLLTPREREVMRMVVDGMTTREISRRLHRSENTVKIHRSNLMRKMRASTPADLARMVTMTGLVESV